MFLRGTKKLLNVADSRQVGSTTASIVAGLANSLWPLCIKSGNDHLNFPLSSPDCCSTITVLSGKTWTESIHMIVRQKWRVTYNGGALSARRVDKTDLSVWLGTSAGYFLLGQSRLSQCAAPHHSEPACAWEEITTENRFQVPSDVFTLTEYKVLVCLNLLKNEASQNITSPEWGRGWPWWSAMLEELT